MKKRNYIANKKIILFPKKDLVPTMTIKNIIKSEIIVTILENIEDFKVEGRKYQNKFL